MRSSSTERASRRARSGSPSGLGVPVVALPAAPARALLQARKDGLEVAIALGTARAGANNGAGRVAPFSSRGLSFGGLVKPDMTAPGTALATSDPGTAADGAPAFATVNGTSAAAASVAGAAALLAQARPGLGALELRSLLVGYAHAAPGASLTTVGAGGLDVGASAAAELAASTASLSFGAWEGASWRATRTFVDPKRLEPASRRQGRDRPGWRVGVAPLHGQAGPRRAPRQGRSARIVITARAFESRAEPAATGIVTVSSTGSQTLRIPWAIAFPREEGTLLPSVALDPVRFRPSDIDPALLRVRAGTVAESPGLQILPVSRLDVLLYRSNGRFVGLLARLRDLLPGSYSFGITGRGPTGAKLGPGGYELRLVAWPVLEGAPSRARVPFTIEGAG